MLVVTDSGRRAHLKSILIGSCLALVQKVRCPGTSRRIEHLLLLPHHAAVRRGGPRLVRGRSVLCGGGRGLAGRLAVVRLLIITTELRQELLHRERLLVGSRGLLMHLRLLWRVPSLGMPASVRATVRHALIQLLVVALRVVVPAAVVRMPSVAAL